MGVLFSLRDRASEAAGHWLVHISIDQSFVVFRAVPSHSLHSREFTHEINPGPQVAEEKSENAEVANDRDDGRAGNGRRAERGRQIVRQAPHFTWDDSELYQSYAHNYLG